MSISCLFGFHEYSHQVDLAMPQKQQKGEVGILYTADVHVICYRCGELKKSRDEKEWVLPEIFLKGTQ